MATELDECPIHKHCNHFFTADIDEIDSMVQQGEHVGMVPQNDVMDIDNTEVVIPAGEHIQVTGRDGDYLITSAGLYAKQTPNGRWVLLWEQDAPHTPQ